MATILVSKQISYSLNKDLGFKKDAIAYIPTDYNDTIKTHKATLLNMLRNIPEIKMVSLSYTPPSSGNTSIETMKYRDGKKEIETDCRGEIWRHELYKIIRHKITGRSQPVSSPILQKKY